MQAVSSARRCQRGRAAPSSLDEDRFLTSKTGSSMGNALYALGRVIFAASFFPAGAFGIRILTLEGAASRRRSREGVGGLPREGVSWGCLGVGCVLVGLGVLGACHCVDAAGGAVFVSRSPKMER